MGGDRPAHLHSRAMVEPTTSTSASGYRGCAGVPARSFELLDDAAVRYPDTASASSTAHGRWHRAAVDGRRDPPQRPRLAAWRLRGLGLQPRDRLLTWSPSTPRLPAVYYGAMMAGLVLVPLDLRMAPEVIKRIADRADTALARARHRPRRARPERAGLGHLGIRTVEWLTADPATRTPASDDAVSTTPSRPTGRPSSTPGRSRPVTTCSRSSTPPAPPAIPRA